MTSKTKVKALLFQPSGWVPNNPDKPVLHYQDVLPVEQGAVAAIE